ncbi:hypothetical protein [Photobacterium gaetbulicola]|uniref:hypothetical protein n=1 Tax=Photobacterium gaetbulicola TaxID=1295392 RepID=UPI000AAEBDBC|nr:hypothetical protein [Photobacterium gaetbulicola]
MMSLIKRGIAAYDRWCEKMGLVPENRRCCAPVRYDGDDPRHPANKQGGANVQGKPDAD